MHSACTNRCCCCCLINELYSDLSPACAFEYLNAFREGCVAVGASTVITLRGYQLDIAVQLPSELKNKNIRGLLGNYNGVASDDLVSPFGRTINANSTEERIYYDFGETCELISHLCSKANINGAVLSLKIEVHEIHSLNSEIQEIYFPGMWPLS